MSSSFSLSQLLRVHSTPGIGTATFRKILAWAEGDAEKLTSLFDMDAETLSKQFKLKVDTATRLINSKHEDSLDLLNALKQAHVSILTESDTDYPAGLRALAENAPPLVYIQGNAALLNTPGIAFSGSRNASERGIEYTRILARQAVERQLTIISGAAPGVDTAAHSEALLNYGATCFVLPEGILRFKPRTEIRPLIENAPDKAVCLSEFPPRMSWSPQNAMMRNGTILAQATAVLIIEAGSEGGTLDAGRRALKQGQQCWVLRYSQFPSSAEGNKLLLQEGAHPLPTEPLPILPALDQPPKPPNTPIQLTLL